MDRFKQYFKEELGNIESAERSREMPEFPAIGGSLLVAGQRWLNFSSNDYLNLAGQTGCKIAAIKALEQYGCSSASSRLISGSLKLHLKLENRLAEFTGQEAALLFGAGYLANCGVLSSLINRRDFVVSDKLSHASILDGISLSKADHKRFKHNDLNHLEEILKKHRKNRLPSSKTLIVSESVFSMNGDIAPITEIYSLAERFETAVLFDDAHSIGVFGSRAQGLAANLLAGKENVFISGSFGKALGSYGGYLACSELAKKFLVNTSRPFIYNTALPPAVLGASLASLDTLVSSPQLGPQLLDHAALFRSLLNQHDLDTMNSSSQIIPLLLGEEGKALSVSKKLREKNIIATAIRPPTVPEKSSRLRFSVTLAHTKEDLGETAGLVRKLVS